MALVLVETIRQYSVTRRWYIEVDDDEAEEEDDLAYLACDQADAEERNVIDEKADMVIGDVLYGEVRVLREGETPPPGVEAVKYDLDDTDWEEV